MSTWQLSCHQTQLFCEHYMTWMLNAFALNAKSTKCNLNEREVNSPWFWVSSRYSEQALIIALLVILNSVARSLVIFTLAWMSVTSGGFLSPLSPELPVAVSSSVTDLWRAWPCFTMRSLHVLRSSSLVDINLESRIVTKMGNQSQCSHLTAVTSSCLLISTGSSCSPSSSSSDSIICNQKLHRSVSRENKSDHRLTDHDINLMRQWTPVMWPQ